MEVSGPNQVMILPHAHAANPNFFVVPHVRFSISDLQCASDRDSLTDELQSLKSKLSDAVDAARRAENAQEEAESRERMAEGTSRRLQDELDDAMERAALHETELEDVRAESMERVRGRDEEIKTLREEGENKDEVVAELQRALKCPTDDGGKLDAAEARIKELEAELEAAVGADDELVREQGAMIDELEAKLADEEAEARKLAELEAKLKASESEVGKFKSEAASNEAKLKSSESNVDKLKSAAIDLEAKLSAANAGISELKAKVTSLESEAESSSGKTADAVASLKTQLATTKAEAAAQRKAASTDSRLVEELRAELEAAKAGGESKKASEEERAHEISELRAQLESASASTEALQADLEAKKASSAKLQVEVSEYKSALANVTLESSQQQEIEAKLRSELSALKAKKPTDTATSADSALIASLRQQIADLQAAAVNQSQPPAPRRRSSSLSSPSPAFQYLSETSINAAVSSALASPLSTSTLANALKNVADKYYRLSTANASLLNRLQSVQHNIQVCCRVRPLTSSEEARSPNIVTEALSDTECGYFDARSKSWRSFAFDRVFGPDDNQQDVFTQVEPLCTSVTSGYNACIFAYGQTGSGKTWTMEGNRINNQFGISYRTLHKILEILKSKKEDSAVPEDFTYTVSMSMLEIYNEEVRDILSTDRTALELKRSADNCINVPGLSSVPVISIEDVASVLERGNKNRAVASTNLNDASSRSHMVLAVDVSSGLVEHAQTKGTMYLVDLAGSERIKKSVVDGAQLKEAQHINKSLSALGDVMEALDKKASHVPYRNSRLTYLLQDSLGGNSKTMMIVTACPAAAQGEETQCALQFATRVRRITLAPATRNVGSKNLEDSMRKLRTELREIVKAKDKAEDQLSIAKRENMKLQQRLANALTLKNKGEADSKKAIDTKIDILRKSNVEINARWQKEKAAREDLHIEAETLGRELKRCQSQMNKLQRDRDNLSKKIVEREHQLMVMGRERSGLGASYSSMVKTPGTKQGSDNEILMPPTPPTGDPVRTPRITAGGDGAGSIRAKVLVLLQKHEPSKVDKLDDLLEKFKGKEGLLLEKMSKRYSGGGGTPGTPGGTGKSRQKLALEKHAARTRGVRR